MYTVSETYDQTWVGFKVWMTGAIEFYLAIVGPSLHVSIPPATILSHVETIIDVL